MTQEETKQLLIDCANFIEPYNDGGNSAEPLMERLEEALREFKTESKKEVSQKEVKDIQVYFKLDNGVRSGNYSVLDLIINSISDEVILEDLEPTCIEPSCNTEGQNFCDCGGIYNGNKVVSAHLSKPVTKEVTDGGINEHIKSFETDLTLESFKLGFKDGAKWMRTELTK